MAVWDMPSKGVWREMTSKAIMPKENMSVFVPNLSLNVSGAFQGRVPPPAAGQTMRPFTVVNGNPGLGVGGLWGWGQKRQGGRTASGVGGSHGRPHGLRSLGDAEVRNLGRLKVLPQHDVGGFEVAMDDGGLEGVELSDALRNAQEKPHPQRPGQLLRAVVQQLAERSSRGELQDQRNPPLGLHHAVQLDQVGVPQLRSDLRFLRDLRV